MSKITIIPPSLNAAWNNLQNNFNEDILEYEEAQYEEELKMVSFWSSGFECDNVRIVANNYVANSY